MAALNTLAQTSNQPPSVFIAGPPNGAIFPAPADIRICAAAEDRDGYVATVEFFAGDQSIGIRTNLCPLCTGPMNPFCLVWSNVPPGSYVLRAKATDNLGASTLSAPIQISVVEPPPPLPIVTLWATDTNAAEPCLTSNTPPPLDVGRFTVRRNAGTNVTFVVRYSVGGTASNGVDYAALSGSVEIPAGRFEADIVVNPLPDSLAEGLEAVVLRLQPVPCIAIFPPPPDCYQIGMPAEAAVLIRECDRMTNVPPRVRLVAPTNGTTFPAPADIMICAAAEDLDGYVATVEFFAGNQSIGIRTNLCPTCTGPMNPFCLVWSNVPPGGYVLRAKATDNLGASTLSEPIQISVGQPPPPLPIVTLWATDPMASEPCLTANLPPPPLDVGRFTVRRNAGTNVPFVVHYSIGGTASNGVDYAALSGSVEIPAGRFEADIVVNPLPDPLTELPETVVLRLQPVPCPAIFPPPPDCYQIGSPAEAAVVIRDCEPFTNAPPRALVVVPTNGAVFVAPVNIPIVTDTVDVDGYVWRVEFFANDRKIGENFKLFLVAPTNGTHIGYEMVWTNPPPGLYALRARAFDNVGLSAFSEPVRISVIGTNPPPPTNLPPLVTITAVDPLAAEGTNCWRWFTNMIGWNDTCRTNFCGTNTATFVVRRSGSTNASLTVAYAIRGSASNGVDYAELPGAVTIPAGERSARITVMPLDDALVECAETVLLELLVSTNTPPDYCIGWPGRAGAVIVDNDRPPPGTQNLCDGTFHLNLPATNNFNYRLEASLDLINWVPVGSSTVTDFGIRFVEPETSDFPARFYRVVPESAPPPP